MTDINSQKSLSFYIGFSWWKIRESSSSSLLMKESLMAEDSKYNEELSKRMQKNPQASKNNVFITGF